MNPRISAQPYPPRKSIGRHSYSCQARWPTNTVFLSVFACCNVWSRHDNPTRARGSVVDWGTMPVRVPDEVDFFNLPNPSSRTMALGSTQPLTEMSTRNLPGGKKRPARRADNLCRHLWAECLNMWESTACTGKTLYIYVHCIYFFMLWVYISPYDCYVTTW
jgi:hypothetical protein